jgi:hypothetical protein
MDKRLLAGLSLMSAFSLRQLDPNLINQIVADISLTQYLTLLITGSVLLDWLKCAGWKDKIPFYLIKCEKHGYQLSYPSGYGMKLFCPKCVE